MVSLLPLRALRPALVVALFAAVHLLSAYLRSSEAARTGWVAHALLFTAGVVTVVFAFRQQRNEAGTAQTSAPLGAEWYATMRQRYALSATGGFLPDECLVRLPAAYEPWEALVDQLPELNKQGALEPRVEALPVLETAAGLTTPEELRRASWVLAALAHSYVNGRNVPWAALGGDDEPSAPRALPEGELRRLPAGLAVPWFEVCGRLGMPPVFTAATADLWNWREVVQPPRAEADHNALSGRLERLAIISSMTGTATEQGFHVLPTAMHHLAAPLILPIFAAPGRLFSSSLPPTPATTKDLTMLLHELTSTLQTMRELFEAVKQTVDVTEFYDIYRPLLAGWTAQPRGAIILDGVKSLPGLAPLGTTLPTVISYHNFESEGTHHPESRAPADSVASDPICNRGGADWAAMAAAGLLRCTADREVVCTAAGPSAGQSTMFSLFDRFLGIDHTTSASNTDNEHGVGCAFTTAGTYQAEQTAYMPTEHRRLLADYSAALTAAGGSVRDYIRKHSCTSGTSVSVEDESGSSKCPALAAHEHAAEGMPAVAAAHSAAVRAMVDFRQYHLGIANRYLGAKASKGTGNTAFKDMLKVAIDGTKAALA